MNTSSTSSQTTNENIAKNVVAERIGRNGHSYVEDVASNLHSVIDATKLKAQAAEAHLRDLSEQAANSSRILQEEAERYIQNNPVMAIGMAVAAGAIFGALLVRR